MNKEEKNPAKCPFCGRPAHKESRYCIFHASAEEKTEEEFKNALKKYIEEIKKDDKALVHLHRYSHSRYTLKM